VQGQAIERQRRPQPLTEAGRHSSLVELETFITGQPFEDAKKRRRAACDSFGIGSSISGLLRECTFR
jgi:hypothetical protein